MYARMCICMWIYVYYTASLKEVYCIVYLYVIGTNV